jgi:hypothetical protein
VEGGERDVGDLCWSRAPAALATRLHLHPTLLEERHGKMSISSDLRGTAEVQRPGQPILSSVSFCFVADFSPSSMLVVFDFKRWLLW